MFGVGSYVVLLWMVLVWYGEWVMGVLLWFCVFIGIMLGYGGFVLIGYVNFVFILFYVI